MATPRHMAALGVAGTAVLALGGSMLTGQRTATTTFDSTVDTFVSALHPTASFSSLPILRVGSNPTDVTYLRFSITGLSGPVLRAELDLYADRAGSSDGLHRVPSNAWSADVTFADAPPYGPVLTRHDGYSEPGWVRFDVRGIVDGDGTFSMALTSPGRDRFASSRAGAALAPRLTVVSGASPPDPTPTPSPTASPAGTPTPTPATPTPRSTPPPSETPAPTPPPTPSGSPSPTPSGIGPVTRWHYTANGNFDGSGRYLPGTDGFNLADVSDRATLDSLPAGDEGLVWLGLCDGADSAFRSDVSQFAGDGRVFGFYLMDEPDPTGQYKTTCPASNLKAESDWIHANLPGTKTFIILMNFSSTSSPTYKDTYNPSNTDIDLFGLDPYPCRTETDTCSYSWIPAAVSAAEAAGIPEPDIVPVYQAFGYGNWIDDGDGHYMLPSAAQEQLLLTTWASVVPAPAFDYAYSWGTQESDTSLSQDPALQAVFAARNS